MSLEDVVAFRADDLLYLVVPLELKVALDIPVDAL